MRSRLLAMGLAVFLLHGAAAKTRAWAQGFGQGTLEASVLSADGVRFGVFCGVGLDDPVGGIYLDDGVPRPDVERSIDVIIDGHRFTVPTKNGLSEAKTREGKDQLGLLTQAFIRSRAKSFSVTIQGSGFSRSFPLANAAKALGGGPSSTGGFITHPCTEP